jgi:hypothetical protein
MGCQVGKHLGDPFLVGVVVPSIVEMWMRLITYSVRP